MAAYYDAGMKGVGKQYTDLIVAAGEESGLTKTQIEVRTVILSCTIYLKIDVELLYNL